MKWLRILLFPLTPVYYAIACIRNVLYDKGLLQSVRYDIPTIGIGNLSVGGTGKTPMVECLIQLLSEQYRIAVLSRGYGRTSKGFILANIDSKVSQIGDEPLQIKKKFPNIIIAVDANRRRGMTQLRKLPSPPNLIILDDVLQHRAVSPAVLILLTTFNNPYFKDMVLPIGDLREPRSGAARADLIVVTKCPEDISENKKNMFTISLNPRNYQSIWFSGIKYNDIVFNDNDSMPLGEFVKSTFTLITGIANPKPLVKFLESRGADFKHLKFPDHHSFSNEEISRFTQLGKILTTEKDFVRLQYHSALIQSYYLPIQTDLKNLEEFKTVIIDKLNN